MNRDWDRLRSTLFAFQKNTTERAISYITQNITPAAGQIPFIWRIYYGRPQICYSLSLRLLHEIYLGKYRETPYLPSYEKMAREYQVSVSTMRRTIDVLSRFRAVESVNGIGTRVCPASIETPDFSTPAVRRNLALFF
ncbi:MAG: GntR family transcriptional regulator [[Clostridium] symbiosum]